MEAFNSVSIPNGMEFYTFVILVDFKRDAFQFPTGWNSTILSFIIESISSKFQFPTGWNSTLEPIYCINRFYSFNSQRDGILRSGKRRPPPFFISFNSQRDGILLDRKIISALQKLFQFPTGWNSTPDDEFA